MRRNEYRIALALLVLHGKSLAWKLSQSGYTPSLAQQGRVGPLATTAAAFPPSMETKTAFGSTSTCALDMGADGSLPYECFADLTPAPAPPAVHLCPLDFHVRSACEHTYVHALRNRIFSAH